MRRFLLLIITAGIFSGPGARAQELRANVSVIADRMKNSDPVIFVTLQKAIQDFLNNRKWTDKTYQPGERIICNFSFNIQQEVQPNVYRALLTVQSLRPVYNSSYTTTLLNYLDKEVTFKYIQSQPLNFNENRVSGDDPLIANLTAVLAYYAYTIIGLDNDSFAANGGIASFKKAQYIVNNAPQDSKNIAGWQSFESSRNRYWLADNLLNQRFSAFHTVMYEYHRLGLDKMYDDMNGGRTEVLNCLNILNALNADNPNTMILQLFFLAKSDELAGIFSQAPLPDRSRVSQLLSQLDPANTSKYQQLAK